MTTKAQATTREVSFLHGCFWQNWQAITGRTPTFDEIHDPRNVRMVNDFVKAYLPELRKLTKGVSK